MRSYQLTHYEGERLSDIDWSFDFSKRFASFCCSEERKSGMLRIYLERFRQMENAFKKGVQVEVLDGDYWHDLIDMGMYDGWPWWKPMPSICIYRVLGTEWHQFPEIDGWRIKQQKEQP